MTAKGDPHAIAFASLGTFAERNSKGGVIILHR